MLGIFTWILSFNPQYKSVYVIVLFMGRLGLRGVKQLAQIFNNY